jgi:hypothetical protein
MIQNLREKFNNTFSNEVYENYLTALHSKYAKDALAFRVAETPIFVDKIFTNKMLDACESIIDFIVSDKFEELSSKAIPANVKVPNDKKFSDFIAFDFGVCENEKGELEPQLIEMQGFPTLFGYQVFQDEVTRQFFDIPNNFSAYLSGLNKASYLQLLKDIILGNHQPKNVVLLEILPHEQKTRIDFYCTQDYLDIQPICLTELIKEGNNLFYINKGIKTPIYRIYNRIIFDDLQQQSIEIQEKGKILLEPLAVEWVPHPNWFYRISKYTIPFILHPFVPPTYFVNELKQIPIDLENYVLKPLFSFAGQGVIIDVEQKDVSEIEDPENWILQRKVKYANVIPTPDVPAKAEIRLFYFWKEGTPRPIPTNNLARLSKGKMIGVRYNKDKEWVGGTLAYFEQ